MENQRYTWVEPDTAQSTTGTDYHPIITSRFTQLGLKTEAQINGFIDPDFYQPSPSKELPGMVEVADRVERAIREKQPICVWGDFDVDGQTSTAILVSSIENLGGNVSYHVPVRGSETHGINIPVLENLINEGNSLFLTCDTGITSNEAVDYAASRNVEILITDHHDPPEDLPKAAGLTNPKFLNSDHPLANLAGVGVAYKLAEELFTRFGSNPDQIPVELAALGLVADLAVLRGDTRFLVQKGLRSLKDTKILGLDLLLQMCELDRKNLTEEQISFTIAPRLNSIGRLTDANIGVELLTTTDAVRAKVILSMVEGFSAESRLLSNQVFGAAQAQLLDNPSLLEQPIVVLSHKAWSGGVLGIAASRLVERYGKPFILLSKPEGELARGSARSTGGLDIHKVIATQKDLLIQSGGHPMAAGMSLNAENIDLFQSNINEIVRSNVAEYSIENNLTIDGYLALNEITLELVEDLQLLSPFGPGNEKPVLGIKNVTVQDQKAIGRNEDHLKFQVRDDEGNTQTVLWWNAGDQSLPEDKFDLAANISINEWKGNKQVQLTLIDIRPSTRIEIKSSVPILEIIDQREFNDPMKILETVPDDTVIWLEGVNRKKETEKIERINPGLRVVNRREFIPSKTLIIWSTPPSQDAVRDIMEKINPNKIILLREITEPTSAETLLRTILGLIKYSIEHNDGIISYVSLASSSNQEVKTIHQAIQWLTAIGEIQIINETGDHVVVSKGIGIQNQESVKSLWQNLSQMLNETIAYQSFFKRADNQTLLQAFDINGTK